MRLPIKLKPGRYIVAVSGGVDSMVLLDVLAGQEGLELIVAHFNHGIRSDSGKDVKLVEIRARQLGLRFELGKGKLGPLTSEDKARQARYKFLRQVQHQNKAAAIVTAHHRDDMLETAAINILRGTGRRGLTAMLENPEVLRPFLHISKKDLLDYAKKHKLEWREDKTNKNETYLRNYIRRRVLNRMSEEQREDLLQNIQKVAKINDSQNRLLATISQTIFNNGKINREQFSLLPTDVAGELLVYWLRTNDVLAYDRKLVARLNTVLRTAKAGTTHHIHGDLMLVIGANSASFERAGK